MSETISEHVNQQSVAQVTYLKDYQVPTYLLEKVSLEFTLEEQSTTVKSKMLFYRHPDHLSDNHDLILNGEELELISVAMNGKRLTDEAFTCTDQYLVIANAPDRFELEVHNVIYPDRNTALSGLYKSSNAYCTQCEAEGFRRITYFPDRPDVLALYTVKMTANESVYPYLLSNGNLIESGKAADGKHYAVWQDPFKKPCYLFALVAGDFDLVEDFFITKSGRRIALKFYTDKGFGDQADHAVYALKQAMKWDEEVYGREYDLDIYMIAAMGDFNMGAMENKGLNIFNTKYVLAKPETATDQDYIHIMSVIAHEYFHNWTGNRVTCRDWFQLSLKEGLTIFRDQSFSEDVLSRAVMRIHEVNTLRESQFPEDAGPLAHSVRPESYIEINNFYTSTIYNKGSEVLRMLHTMLGREKFRKAMDLYFERFDGQAVTIDDYIAVMEEVSGMNLTQFKRWYSQAGTPVVNVVDDYDVSKKIYTLRLSQSCPATPGQPEKLDFHIPVRVGLLDQQGRALPLKQAGSEATEELVLHLKSQSQQFQFHDVPSRPLPSLLRNFSAPVKLRYAYTLPSLLILIRHDKDPFNRWEAMQRYVLRLMLESVISHQQDEALHLPKELIDIYHSLLQEENSDLFFISEMLRLPSENYIGEQMDVVDVDAIHAVREFFIQNLAVQLESQFKSVYLTLHAVTQVYQFTMQDVGKRQLKNVCLAFLMKLPGGIDLALNQFGPALKSNMTDTLAALNGLSNTEVAEAKESLNIFYQTWKKDPLVVDKWLAAQAKSSLANTLQTVKDLMRHESFDIKNPNKVYALIGTFGHQNPAQLHAANGEGYAFLAQAVQALDRINPQVAARMVKPLTRFNRYDKERQTLIKNWLNWLLEDRDISPDLYELVTKSLESKA